MSESNWKWWTSNSWKRLVSSDGTKVLYPYAELSKSAWSLIRTPWNCDRICTNKGKELIKKATS